MSGGRREDLGFLFAAPERVDLGEFPQGFRVLGVAGEQVDREGHARQRVPRLSSDGRRELRDLGEALQFCHPQSKSFEFLPYDAGRAAPRSPPRGPAGWMPSRHCGSTAQPTYGMLPARVRVARSLGARPLYLEFDPRASGFGLAAPEGSGRPGPSVSARTTSAGMPRSHASATIV